jgi:hypothetical protein
MSNNSNNQQPKAEPKAEAISSLILGIISILADLSMIVPVYFRISIDIGNLSVIDDIAPYSLFGGWFFPTSGLVLGIMGLKSTKKKLAITGIILSTIGLMAYIYALTLL